MHAPGGSWMPLLPPNSLPLLRLKSRTNTLLRLQIRTRPSEAAEMTVGSKRKPLAVDTALIVGG